MKLAYLTLFILGLFGFMAVQADDVDYGEQTILLEVGKIR